MIIKIDGRDADLEAGTTILKAAKDLNIPIPTLCHNDKLTPYGGCRICLVEVTQRPPARSRLLPACCTVAEDGMEVVTDSERVRNSRIFAIELLLSRCPESQELKDIAAALGLEPENRSTLDIVGDYLLHRAKPEEHTKCIRCGLCVRVCAEITERHALSFSGRGMKRKVESPFSQVADTCIGCGSCAYVCPTNTITIEEASDR